MKALESDEIFNVMANSQGDTPGLTKFVSE